MSEHQLAMVLGMAVLTVLATIFLLLHFYLLNNRYKHASLSHYNKAETIVGHCKKYFLITLSMFFYVTAASLLIMFLK